MVFNVLQNCHSWKNCKCIEFKRANNDSFKPHKSSQHVLEFQVRFLPSLLFTGVMASGSTLRSNTVCLFLSMCLL